jgi:hypothetical protein
MHEDVRRYFRGAALGAVLLGAAARSSLAAVAPHSFPLVFNLRDYYLPAKGLYTGLYVPYYHSGEIHDSAGDKTNTLTAPTAQGPVSLNVGSSVDSVVLAPILLWSTNVELLGGRYGGLLVPTFANDNQALAIETPSGGVSSRSSEFALGDLLFEPVWLDWSLSPFETSLSYGLIVPTGKFNVATTALPNGAQVRVPESGSTGSGYWSSQFQGSAAWYPWEDKRLAASLTGTYEVPSKERNIDVTPGSYFTLAGGLTQYVPLIDKSTLLEAGPVGFGEWQLTRDRGGDVLFSSLGRVLGAGVQAGVTFVPQKIAVNLRYLNEFRANGRFQGETVSGSVTAKVF